MNKQNKEVILDETPLVEESETINNVGDSAYNIIDETQDDVIALPSGATRNADGSVTLKLQTPASVQIKDASGQVRIDEYNELIFYPLNGADLRAIYATKPDMYSVMCFARSTRIKVQVMNVLYDKLNASDIIKGSSILEAFTSGGQPKK